MCNYNAEYYNICLSLLSEHVRVGRTIELHKRWFRELKDVDLAVATEVLFWKSNILFSISFGVSLTSASSWLECRIVCESWCSVNHWTCRNLSATFWSNLIESGWGNVLSDIDNAEGTKTSTSSMNLCISSEFCVSLTCASSWLECFIVCEGWCNIGLESLDLSASFGSNLIEDLWFLKLVDLVSAESTTSAWNFVNFRSSGECVAIICTSSFFEGGIVLEDVFLILLRVLNLSTSVNSNLVKSERFGVLGDFDMAKLIINVWKVNNLVSKGSCVALTSASSFLERFIVFLWIETIGTGCYNLATTIWSNLVKLNTRNAWCEWIGWR